MGGGLCAPLPAGPEPWCQWEPEGQVTRPGPSWECRSWEPALDQAVRAQTPAGRDSEDAPRPLPENRAELSWCERSEAPRVCTASGTGAPVSPRCRE